MYSLYSRVYTVYTLYKLLIVHPTGLHFSTLCTLNNNNDFKDDEVFNSNDNESKMTEDYSSTDNRDATDLDDDLNLESLNDSELHEKARAPKIWISKSASMEHDLD